jgi:transposase InsO family protein
VGDVKHITTPWYFVAIDFVLGELPLSHEEYKYCLTVMCVFTRFPFALPLRTKEPDEIATALYNGVFSIFGFPVVVHSDHDTTLISQALELVFKRFHVRRTFTLWSHPQSNGHLERFHRYLNETMAIILPRYPDWPEMLPVVMFAYRNMVQETTGYSPQYLNFGRDALMPLEVTWCLGAHEGVLKPADFTAASQEYAERLISRLQGAFQFVRRAQQLASAKNKERPTTKKDQVVKRESPIHFEAGDSVYL